MQTSLFLPAAAEAAADLREARPGFEIGLESVPVVCPLSLPGSETDAASDVFSLYFPRWLLARTADFNSH